MQMRNVLRSWPCAATVAAGSLVPLSTVEASFDLKSLTVTDIQAGYAAGDFTAVELTEAYLNQIETYNPYYNAWTTVDDAGALSAAAEADAYMADHGSPGGLFGVPVAIKDPMDVQGMPTTAGSTAFSSEAGGVDIIPDTDSPLVGRLRDSGMIILGKTNVPDFSRSGTNSTSTLMGATKNAYDISRVPGGSSGGSGVAVATGMAPMATAEETGSSITNPASASSLVGIRPTSGLVPITGVFPLAGTFRDVMGPLGKTVEDAALMFDSIAGPTQEDLRTLDSGDKIPDGGYVENLQPGQLDGARIGVYGPGYNTVELAPETQELFDRELDVLSGLGATLLEDPFEGTDWSDALGRPFSGTFSYDVSRYLERLGPGAAFNSIEEYESLTGESWYDIERMPNETPMAEPIIRADLDDYLEYRSTLRRLFDEIMEDNELDALVMPQLAEPVPTLESGDFISRTPGGMVNDMGIPGVVLPGGYFDDGTPFAMYFIGQQWEEMSLLNLAYDYEQATLHRTNPTLIPEPASLAILGVGGIVMLSRRRKV